MHVACAGAIELAILSEHFRLEFAVVDVQTLRVDRFGEQFPSSYAHMVVCDACSRKIPKYWTVKLMSPTANAQMISIAT